VIEESRLSWLRCRWRCITGRHHWHETTMGLTPLDHCCNCPATRPREAPPEPLSALMDDDNVDLRLVEE
jgi:hypothetical protein